MARRSKPLAPSGDGTKPGCFCPGTALIALFCLGNGLILLNAFIVILFWDDHSLLALGLLSLVYLIAGAAVAMVVRAKAQAGSKLFAASLAELEKDRQALRSGSE